MDTATIEVLVGGTLLIGFTLWFFFGNREDERAIATRTGQAVYECPMHNWITSPDPTAVCSLCGMQLIRRGEVKTKNPAF